MCRIVAYAGRPIKLSEVILDPPHSLLHQSKAARQMEGSQTAGDGWGVGWFTETRPSQPGLFKNILPLWSDQNAKTLAPAIASGCFVGHVRAASEDIEVCLTNTPLFEVDDYLFTLNGELKPWPGALSRALRAELDDESEARMRGATDAEMLSALWRTYLVRSATKDVGAALRKALLRARTLALSFEGSIKASVIIAHGAGFVAARFGSPKTPGTLYYTAGEKRWPEGVLVASEPLADDASWHPVDPGTLIHANREGNIRFEPIE